MKTRARNQRLELAFIAQNLRKLSANRGAVLVRERGFQPQSTGTDKPAVKQRNNVSSNHGAPHHHTHLHHQTVFDNSKDQTATFQNPKTHEKNKKRAGAPL
jgi:hypothetical protein